MENAPPCENTSGGDTDYHDWYAKDDDEAHHYLQKGYRSTLGHLIYIASTTRPDTRQSIAVLARYSQRPGKKAFEALMKHVRFLKGTRHWRLTYYGHATKPVPWEHIRAKVWVDADHASCPETRKSYTGIAVHIGVASGDGVGACPGGAVQWHCKRQGLATGSTTNATIAQDNTADVAVHSTDAEVLALLDACSPVRVIRNLLAEAGAAGQPPTEVFTDSLSLIHI